MALKEVSVSFLIMTSCYEKKKLALEEVRNPKRQKLGGGETLEDPEAEPELPDTITEEWWDQIPSELSQFDTMKKRIELIEAPPSSAAD